MALFWLRLVRFDLPKLSFDAAQALAHSSGAALRISRELVGRKLEGQEQVARHKLLDTSKSAFTFSSVITGILT